MGGGKTHEVLVTLTRNSANEPWGFSLVGGVDVKTPLIVTRVSFGSRADGVLQRGDIITKIGNYDSRDIRHQDAQTLFNNSGNSVRVVVQREPSKIRKGGSAGSSLTSPLSVSPHLSPRGGGAVSSPGYSPGAPALTPYYSTPFTPLDDYHFSVQDNFGNFGGGRGSEDPNLHVTNQPYRTTPLVLPGAKAKRDAGHTESYLRHHPNPAVRNPPSHIVDVDHVLKSKVANTVLNRIQVADPNIQVVHKQFNSPINMYSDANIADTLAKQGVKVRKPVKYNPAESETYRAVQEEQLGDNVQEVLIPPQPKVFTPHKPAQVKIADPQYQLPKKMPENPETIHQSNSFKRLMWSVMAESSY
nr:PDZ and LIM domain protein 3 isoform X1 [Onthophagus taurus]